MPIYMVECTECDAELEEGSQFCSQCGAEVEDIDPGLEVPDKQLDKDVETVPFTEWAYGFEAGSTTRNLVVGWLHFVVFPVAVFLLLHAFWKNRDRASKASGNAVGALFIVVMFLLVGIVGAGVTGGGGETVLDRTVSQETTDHFEAEEGDTITVQVDNRFGFRTHVVVDDPTGEQMLSQGVEDEASYQFTAEESGEFIVRIQPADNDARTSGNVEIVIE